jgi:hypothetical protein
LGEKTEAEWESHGKSLKEAPETWMAVSFTSFDTAFGPSEGCARSGCRKCPNCGFLLSSKADNRRLIPSSSAGHTYLTRFCQISSCALRREMPHLELGRSASSGVILGRGPGSSKRLLRIRSSFVEESMRKGWNVCALKATNSHLTSLGLNALPLSDCSGEPHPEFHSNERFSGDHAVSSALTGLFSMDFLLVATIQRSRAI